MDGLECARILTVVVGAGAGGRAVPGGLGRQPATAVGQQGSVLRLRVGGVVQVGLLLGASAIGDGDHGEERGHCKGGLEGERGGHCCSSCGLGTSALLGSSLLPGLCFDGVRWRTLLVSYL